MNDRLFNSALEMELRLLLLLSSEREAMTLERLISLDFIICYAEKFQLPYVSLHGKNDHMYGEIASRRMLARVAVKDMVTSGMVDISADNDYFYKINVAGRKYSRLLQSEYAKQYRKIAAEAIKLFKKYSDDELSHMIQRDGVKALQEGGQ